MELKVEELQLDWLTRSFVGPPHKCSDVESLVKNFVLGGVGFLSPRYMGDHLVLIIRYDGMEIGKVVVENKE